MSTMGYVSTLAGAEESASVILDFEKQDYKLREGGKQVTKKFSDLITFARSTTGGRFNSQGMYEVVPAHQPRFDYDPLTKALRGLLVEEQRTNLSAYSDRPLVQVTRATFVSDGEVWIDGLTQFKKIVEDTSNGSHFGLPTSITVQPDATYTFSYFLKSAGRTKVQFQMQNAASWVGSPGPSVEVDLVAKTITGVSSIVKMQEIGNGVFRISVTVTTKGAATGTVAFSSTCYPVMKDAAGLTSYTGDGVSGMYIGGYQAEAGGFETSYLQTPESFTSRASTATYFDSKGVLRTAGVNVARNAAYAYNSSGKLVPVGLLTEAASVNLLPNSNRFTASAWGAYSDSGATVLTKVLPNKGLSPTGDMDASLLVMGTSNCLLTQNLAASPSLPYTMSVWMRGVVGGEKVRLEFRSVTSQGTSWAAPITLTKEWVRYSVSGMNTGVEGVRGFQFRKNTVDGGEQSFYIYGAQIEQSSVLSSYVPTSPSFASRASTATYFDKFGVMQTAPVNTPRSEAFSRSGARIGLLIEAAATNFVKYSNGVGAGWVDTSNSPNKLAVTANATAAPDGTTTATLIEFPSKDAGTTQTWNQQVGQLVAGATLSPSVWMKADQPALVQIRRGDGVAGYEAFQVTTEWQRFESAPGVNSGTTFNFGIANPASNAVAPFKLYMWGAQLEYGGFATSEIPTAAAGVTRAADVYSSAATTRAADVTSSVPSTRAFDSTAILDLSSWYNPLEGTFDVSFTPGVAGLGGTGVAFYFRSSEDAAKDVIVSRRNGSGEVISVVTDSAGVNQAILSGLVGTSPGTRFHCALAIKKDNFAFDVNGRLGPALDTVGTLPSPTRVHFGNGGNNSQNTNGHIHKFSYYPVRLSNSQLEVISA